MENWIPVSSTGMTGGGATWTTKEGGTGMTTLLTGKTVPLICPITIGIWHENSPTWLWQQELVVVVYRHLSHLSKAAAKL